MSGIISGPIILFYIFIAYLIYKTILSATQKKILSRVIFALILTFPFWDLMAQKVIKTYYQAFLMEPKIYALPEVDVDGRVESLDLGDRLNWLEKKKEDILNEYLENIYGKILEEKIKFLDFTFNIKGENKIYRFYLEDKKVKHKVLDEAQAKYKIVVTKPKFHLGLYQTFSYKLVETSNNKVLAEARTLYFLDVDFFDFRNILPASARVVRSLNDFEEMMKKVFGVKRFY